MGEVGDGSAHDVGGGQLAYLHARVVLDFGERGADDVRERDRHAPGPAGRGSGEDDQALRVPSHARRQVVEAEQVTEFVRVLRPAFHGVEQAELPVDEDLAAAGEVDEDSGDATREFGPLDGGAQGGTVHRAERFDDLARLVLGRGSLRRLHVDVNVVARPELAYGVRQLAASDLQGAVAEPDEFDDEAAPDAYGDDQGGHDGDESEEHRGPGRGEHAPGQGVGAVGGVPCRTVGDGALLVQHGRVGGVPGAARGRREGLLAGLGEEHLVLDGCHVGVRGSCQETLPRGAFGAAQITRCRLDECLPGVGGAGEPAQSLAVEGAREPGARQQNVLTGQHLARP